MSFYKILLTLSSTTNIKPSSLKSPFKEGIVLDVPPNKCGFLFGQPLHEVCLFSPVLVYLIYSYILQFKYIY